jgi:hypothetical protein
MYYISSSYQINVFPVIYKTLYIHVFKDFSYTILNSLYLSNIIIFYNIKTTTYFSFNSTFPIIDSKLTDLKKVNVSL